MIDWSPDGAERGRFYRFAHACGKPKYHLCVEELADGRAGFLVLSTFRRRRRLRGIVDCKLLPLPPSATGCSEVDLSALIYHDVEHVSTSVCFGPIGTSAAKRLLAAWNERDVRNVHARAVWTSVLETLASAAAPDPDQRMRRKLRDPALRKSLRAHDAASSRTPSSASAGVRIGEKV